MMSSTSAACCWWSWDTMWLNFILWRMMPARSNCASACANQRAGRSGQKDGSSTATQYKVAPGQSSEDSYTLIPPFVGVTNVGCWRYRAVIMMNPNPRLYFYYNQLTRVSTVWRSVAGLISHWFYITAGCGIALTVPCCSWSVVKCMMLQWTRLLGCSETAPFMHWCHCDGGSHA
jgi:hypothetical protein